MPVHVLRVPNQLPVPRPSPLPTPRQSAATDAGGSDDDGAMLAGTVVGLVLAVLIIFGGSLGSGVLSTPGPRGGSNRRPLGDGYKTNERRRSTTGMTSVADDMSLMENPSFAVDGSKGQQSRRGLAGWWPSAAPTVRARSRSSSRRTAPMFECQDDRLQGKGVAERADN